MRRLRRRKRAGSLRDRGRRSRGGGGSVVAVGGPVAQLGGHAVHERPAIAARRSHRDGQAGGALRACAAGRLPRAGRGRRRPDKRLGALLVHPLLVRARQGRACGLNTPPRVRTALPMRPPRAGALCGAFDSRQRRLHQPEQSAGRVVTPMRAWEARPPPSHPRPAPAHAPQRHLRLQPPQLPRRQLRAPRVCAASQRNLDEEAVAHAPHRAPRGWAPHLDRVHEPPVHRPLAARHAAELLWVEHHLRTCGSAVTEALHAAAADAARRGPTQRPVRTFSSTACPAWYARAVSNIESLSAMALKSKAALESGTAWPRRRRMPPTESTSAHSHRRAVESPTNVSERPRRTARALSLPTSPKPQQRASLAHCHWPECHSPAPERSRQALGSHELDMLLCVECASGCEVLAESRGTPSSVPTRAKSAAPLLANPGKWFKNDHRACRRVS